MTEHIYGIQGIHEPTELLIGVPSRRENLFMDHSGQHPWRVPHSLHVKNLFSRFRKRVPLEPLQKIYRPYQTLHISPVAVKSCWTGWPIFSGAVVVKELWVRNPFS